MTFQAELLFVFCTIHNIILSHLVGGVLSTEGKRWAGTPLEPSAPLDGEGVAAEVPPPGSRWMSSHLTHSPAWCRLGFELHTFRTQGRNDPLLAKSTFMGRIFKRPSVFWGEGRQIPLYLSLSIISPFQSQQSHVSMEILEHFQASWLSKLKQRSSPVWKAWAQFFPKQECTESIHFQDTFQENSGTL